MHFLKLQRPACVLGVGLPLGDEKQRGKAFAQLVFLLFPVPSAQDHRIETPTFRVSLPDCFFSLKTSLRHGLRGTPPIT